MIIFNFLYFRAILSDFYNDEVKYTKTVDKLVQVVKNDVLSH